MPDYLKDLEIKIKAAFDSLKQELMSIRTNRPTPKLVEDIEVDYLGQRLTIKQVGSISIIPPREINISVWDRNAVVPVIKAIEASRLGVGANADGNLIRVSLPSLSDERRQELIKVVKKIIEETRIKIRSGRDETNKKIEQGAKEKIISEDEKFKLKKKTQEGIDKINQEIEMLMFSKIKEINE